MIIKNEWLDAEFIGVEHLGFKKGNVYSICITEDKDYQYNVNAMDSEENELYAMYSSEKSFFRYWKILEKDEQ